MGAQASSAKSSHINRSGGSTRKGVQAAAPFASADEHSESPLRRCAPPCRAFPSALQDQPQSISSMWCPDLEAGFDFPSNVEDAYSARQASKATVLSVDSTAMPPSEPKRRDTIAGVNDSSPCSTSHSFFKSRSLSTPHLRGEAVANTEECYARHLEEVHRGKWADRWAIPTPSTASPSRAPSRGSQTSSSLTRSSRSSLFDSRPGSSVDSVSSSSSNCGKDPRVKAQLKDARHRARASFEALQSELRGSAPIRYSTWPMGCAVRVSFDGPDAVGCVSDTSDSGVLAVLVRHNASDQSFEVKLHDGSSRVVPERCVTRVRRGLRNQSSIDPACQASRVSSSKKLEASIAESPAQIVHKALGHADRHPPSSKPRHSRMEIDQHGMHPLAQMMGNSQIPCEA